MTIKPRLKPKPVSFLSAIRKLAERAAAKKQQGGGEAGGGEAGGAQTQEGEEIASGKEDVVDAEFEEVKDDEEEKISK